MVRPRLTTEALLDDLGRLVAAGSYVAIDHPTALSDVLKPFVAGRSKLVVVAASATTCSATWGPGGGGCDGSVFLVRNFRYCTHDGNPHVNADDTVAWRDRRGRPWLLSSRHGSDHYRSLSAGTTTNDVVASFHIPPERRGTIERFRAAGGMLTFWGSTWR